MKVLLTPITSSSVAHIVRSFSVAQELKKSGHEVFFTSCVTKQKYIESNGYKVVRSYPPFNLNDPEDQSLNYLESHKEEMIGWFSAEIEAAKEVKPDVVVTSPGFFGPVVTHALGIPTIALLNGQYVPSSKGLMGLSMATDSVSDRVTRTLLRPLFKKKFIKEYLSHINDAYGKLGVRNDFASQEELYEGMSILIPGDEEFEPQNYPPYNNAKWIGPMFWDGMEDNKELNDEFLEEFTGNKKLIYLGFGGSVFSKETYELILEEFVNLDAQKIVALGPNFNRNDFVKDNESLVIRNFVPGLRVSKYADIVVNTGAQGSIMQALTYGKPVVAFSVGIDQAYFSNRLEELGVGVNVNKQGILGFADRESYTISGNNIPKRIIADVERVLVDQTYLNKATDYAERLALRKYLPTRSVLEEINRVTNKR